jgi:hypothetical protein
MVVPEVPVVIVTICEAVYAPPPGVRTTAATFSV